MDFLVLLLVCMMLGSLPFGLIVCSVVLDRDPRNHGSGNIGLTNVMRLGNTKAAILTLLGDLLKGTIPVAWAMSMEIGNTQLGVLAFMVVWSHCYSIYLDFNGGKGVATAGGVLLALHPGIFFTVAGCWLIIYKTVGTSSLSALISAVLLIPLALSWMPDQIWTCLAMTLLVFWRHQGNIHRLKQGTELNVR